MKLFKLQFIAFFLLSITVLGCKSAAEKNEAAKENLKDAQAELKEAEQNAADVQAELVKNEEWIEFKRTSLAQIEENDQQIAELKVKMSKSGKTFDTLYAKRIERLEEDNASMRMRIIAYEKGQSGWESFKAEFNHDMEAIGNGIRELSVDNK